MSKSNSGSALNSIGKVLTYILVVLLVLGIVGGVAYFFMRGQGVTYYVEYNDTQYLANGDGGSIGLRTGETHEFSVKSLTGDEVNYSVKVISNVANNFSFSIGDELHRFYEGNDANDDYSSLFGLQKSADGFTITIPNNVTVESIVSEKFGGKIELLSELSDEYSYFVIVVSSGDSVVNLWFTFDGNVTDITLDMTHIIFGGDSAASENPPSEADEAAALREDLGDLMERYEPMR